MSNLVVQENQLAGNPDTEWDLSGPGSTNIEGFATDISVNRGQTVSFKVNTNSSNYRIDLYRLGYYGGLGARKVGTLQQGRASAQPPPVTNPSLGLVDAGNWSVSASWGVPASAVSGVYIAHLVRQDGVAGENHIPFIVRDDGAAHDLVFQTSDTTWHAYNGWGGYSLYGGGAGTTNDGRACKVSYNRPIATRDGVGTYAGPQDFLFGVEIAAIRWLEANGYDVCYIAGMDTDRRGGELLNKKVFLSVGHDEYWSGNQRSNVEAARAAGVHLAFWSGNEVFWKTRYEDSTVTTDGSLTVKRTLVCYKETREDAKLDPSDPPTWTGTWRDPRFSPPADGARPENALTGTIFMVDDFREDQVLIPYPMSKLRFWLNTSVGGTMPGNSGSLVRNLLGYEWDESPDNGFRPAGLVHLSLTTVSVNTYILDYGHTEGPGIATHSLSLYRDQNSRALVFGAGTVMWAWGLDGNHDPDPKDPTPTPTDASVKQAMVNLFGDMGVFAQTLQSGLVPVSQSTDTAPPVSAISNPVNGATVPQNQTITITGTASDTAGQVAGVEVSTDGGTTWHPATMVSFDPVNHAAGWNYNWTPGLPGSYTIRARSVDDSINLEANGPSVSVTVAGATGLSLFSGSDAPAVVGVNDPNPVELGVKVQSSQAGTVTAIRFYKGPSNTGTHVGNLWSASGALLSSATFSGESASGWQQVSLSAPVSMTANTLYVVSYHTNGNYSADNDYYDHSSRVNGPLMAPDTVSGNGNGLYGYGSASTFPTNSYLGSNYWVDLVFNPGGAGGSQPPVATNDSGFVTTQNTALTIQASQLLANDSDPNGNPSSLSITGVSSPTNGTVVLNTGSPQSVTFTPTGGFTGSAGFTYTITNGHGTASAQVALTVNPAGTTSYSLFNANSTPGTVTDADASAVELGVKFQSSVAGKVSAIRFYKGPKNTGTHTGHLWSATGTSLAMATFSGETANGWQQVNLATPVSINANTTYVVSYHTNKGFYSTDVNYFTASRTNGVLTALASGSSGGNGLYLYGSTSKFPTNSYQASNYWVDVVFTST